MIKLRSLLDSPKTLDDMSTTRQIITIFTSAIQTVDDGIILMKTTIKIEEHNTLKHGKITLPK